MAPVPARAAGFYFSGGAGTISKAVAKGARKDRAREKGTGQRRLEVGGAMKEPSGRTISLVAGSGARKVRRADVCRGSPCRDRVAGEICRSIAFPLFKSMACGVNA